MSDETRQKDYFVHGSWGSQRGDCGMYRSMDFQRHIVTYWESASVEQQLALDAENQARAKKSKQC
jgi:hypothetical protein